MYILQHVNNVYIYIYTLESAGALPQILLPAYSPFTYTIIAWPVSMRNVDLCTTQRPRKCPNTMSRAQLSRILASNAFHPFTFPVILTFTMAITFLRSSKTTYAERVVNTRQPHPTLKNAETDHALACNAQSKTKLLGGGRRLVIARLRQSFVARA